MRHIIICAFIAGCTANATPTDTIPHEAAQHTAPRAPVLPVAEPEPDPLPYGIDEAKAWQDPKEACQEQAEELGTFHQRKGLQAYCEWRIWAARRGVKEPKRHVDGSYIHDIDVRQATKVWDRAYAAGWIDPHTCPEHARKYARKLFTRGKFFDLSLAYTGHYLTEERPIPCYSPEIFDWNNVGARMVVSRAKSLCRKHSRSSCSKANIKKWW